MGDTQTTTTPGDRRRGDLEAKANKNHAPLFISQLARTSTWIACILYFPFSISISLSFFGCISCCQLSVPTRPPTPFTCLPSRLSSPSSWLLSWSCYFFAPIYLMAAATTMATADSMPCAIFKSLLLRKRKRFSYACARPAAQTNNRMYTQRCAELMCVWVCGTLTPMATPFVLPALAESALT